MTVLTLAALGAALALFAWFGLRAAPRHPLLDDYLTARNSQTGRTLGLSFLASGMGAWILFVPPEIGALVGPVAIAGYAIGAALPFLVLGFLGQAIRDRLPSGRSIGEFAEACYGTLARRAVSFAAVAYMAIFLAAELTAIGAITAILTNIPPSVVVIGVAASTLLYITIGGLRASLGTDRLQAWLLAALLLLICGVLLWQAPSMPAEAAIPMMPMDSALQVALTLIIAVTAANLFHQGYWQRVWAAQDTQALRRGAWLGGAGTIVVVGLLGGIGIFALMLGVPLGDPPVPFFALLTESPAWIKLTALVLAVTLVASSVDTLQNGIASLLVASSKDSRRSLSNARWLTVGLMVPVILVALEGYSVLRLFLIADLLCAALIVPVLLGLWRRMTAKIAIAGGLAGLFGAILPGWLTTGSLQGGLAAASFPGGIPTLAPFLGALVVSTFVCLLLATIAEPRSTDRPTPNNSRRG